MNKKRRIIFRADGNSAIGLGHIMRSLELASLVKDEFKCYFATRFLSPEIKVLIERHCKDIFILPKDDTHYSKFPLFLKNDDLVVLDGYFFAYEYQKKIRNIVHKLIIIDDLVSGKYSADLIINHGPGYSPQSYKTDTACKFLLGIDYALIRNEFLKFSGVINARENNFFVCFGGADPLKLSEKFASILLEINDINHIFLVLGSQNKISESIKTIVKGNKEKISLLADLDVKEMIKVMQKCKYAVVSSSTVLYEVMSLGMKPFAGYYAENQINLYNYFLTNNNIFGLNDLRIIDSFKTINYIGGILRDPQTLKKIQIGKKRDEIKTKIKELADGK